MIMIDNKNSEIILCSGIKMDKNYENVLSYSESSLVSLCRANQIYNAMEYTFLGNTNYIDVECPYSIAMYSNYVAFINPNFGNKWIFAWVTDTELLNPKTTRIYFEKDVWSTWYERFTLNQAFIEREHVEDDTFGKHTIPEQLETGDYIVKNETDASDLTDVCPVVAATVDPNNNNVLGSYIGNRYESLGYYIFTGTRSLSTSYDTGEQVQVISYYLDSMATNGKSDSIVSVFMAPKKLAGWTSSGNWYTGSLISSFHWRDVDQNTSSTAANTFTDLSTTRPTTFGTYTPVNNKLYVWPYSYMNLTNNNGGNATYRYEDFSNNTPTFQITGIITPSCSIHAAPKNYKSQTVAYNYGLPAAKYPICSWNNDIYTNWLTQQGVNIALDTTRNISSIIGGSVSGNIGGITGGISGIAGTMASIYEHSLIPPQARGNVNGGDVSAGNNKLTFTLQDIQIREEMARVIDSYFSKFGYKVNEVKTPNLNSRTQFNFIKVGGMDELISGDIPASDLEKINNICRKGVTIFHDYSNFGNYTISNPIVTP